MYGGLGAHVLALTCEQARQGHDVVVVTQQSHAKNLVGSMEIVDGVRVIRADNAYSNLELEQNVLDQWCHGFALGSLTAATNELANWIPDVIHGHDWIAAVQSRFFASQTGSPHVMTVHATEMGRHSGWLTSRVSRVVYARELQAIKSADHIIVCSDYMRDELVTSLFASFPRISVIPNGVNIADFEISKPQNLQGDVQNESDFIIGFLGRVEWEKGAHHVIDALKYLPEDRFTISVIGDGSELEGLRQKVKRNGFNDRVQFHGNVSTRDKQRFLAQCDALVIPSSYEPFGIVALEAGAARIPLITSQVGGLRDIVPNSRFGYPLAQLDGSHIASSIREIELFPSEAKLRTQLLFERIEANYTWSRIAEVTESIYDRVIEMSSDAEI